LREFCAEHGHDPSNGSKIEREVLPPPRDAETLRAWARQLGLKQGSDDWCKFSDYAAVNAGRIPDYVLKDEELEKPSKLLRDWLWPQGPLPIPMTSEATSAVGSACPPK